MSIATNGHALVDGTVTKIGNLELLQEEMSLLVKELSDVQDMTGIQRQRLQVRFELKALEVKQRILQAEQDDLAAQLPACREEIEAANASVKSAQERYRDALNRFNAIDEKRKRLAAEADQIQRECESVRLRMP